MATIATIVALSLILLSVWAIVFVLYLVVKQQGRLLLRLDAIEERLEMSTEGAARAAGARAAEAQRGLPVGTPFPSFKLPHLTGQEVSLEDFRGKRTLLVNWSPQCGFCDVIAPDLAKLKEPLEKRDVQLVFLAHSDAEKNSKLAEEHGLKYPILLVQNGNTPEPFASLGTPAAYLLDKDGKVAKSLAVGANMVPSLAQEAAGLEPTGSEAMNRRANPGAGKPSNKKRLPGLKSLSESKIERNGLKPGTPAPLFTLPDIYGNTVSLTDYRGQRVLLVFSDPHCNPCQELAYDLVHLDREHRDNGLSIVMVGRGDVGENRRKAEEHGIEFPIVIQDKWRLSKEYGIFATPVAFLIDEQGIITREVARGLDSILALFPKKPRSAQERNPDMPTVQQLL